jgi:hypothetical protein
MTDSRSNPPRLAIWWLRHACPGRDNDALTGDLIERFRQGQTRGWFWKQVFIAITIGVLREIGRHWPHFCYAIVGTALTWLFWDAPALRRVPAWLHWNELPWPWSQVAFELSRPALLALAALSILAAGRISEHSFRWASLLRTAVLNLALITFGHYSLDLFPWLLRPVPGHPNYKQLVIPSDVLLLLSFLAFLVAAWLGCRLPPQRRVANPRPAL